MFAIENTAARFFRVSFPQLEMLKMLHDRTGHDWDWYQRYGLQNGETSTARALAKRGLVTVAGRRAELTKAGTALTTDIVFFESELRRTTAEDATALAADVEMAMSAFDSAPIAIETIEGEDGEDIVLVTRSLFG